MAALDAEATPLISRAGSMAGGVIALPAISAPKGGGAIRGIGEKLAANPVTGSGSVSVPLGVSPGRSSFGPQLALVYDSGAEWMTPNQIAKTALGSGKWNQIIRRMSLCQEARDQGWRLHAWSQRSQRYIGDITDWQQLTTKDPHLKWPADGSAAPAASPPAAPNAK